jgi:hypothetical protein
LLQAPTGHLAEFAAVRLAAGLQYDYRSRINALVQHPERVGGRFLVGLLFLFLLHARDAAAARGDHLACQVLAGKEGSDAQVQALIGVAHLVQGVVQVGDANLVPACLKFEHGIVLLGL